VTKSKRSVRSIAATEPRGGAANGHKPHAPTRRAPRANRRASTPTLAGGVSGRMTARLVKLLQIRERDAGAVLARAGVTLAEITHPSARIPYAAADSLVEGCVHELGVDGFSVALANVFDDTTYDAAGLALLSGPTFGEGLTRAFAYQRLWADGDRFSLVRSPDDGEGLVRFRHPGPSALAAAVLAEVALLETPRGARTLVDPSAQPVAIRFEHASLSSSTILADAFGATPEYGAAQTGLVLSKALLDSPIGVPPEVLKRIVDHVAQDALAALPASASFCDRVRAIVTEDPRAFSLGVTDIARRLGMSGRTVQRRLQSEGTSWAEIVDDLRRARAEELGLRRVSDKEITFLLGFADVSGLARARARWRH